MEYSRPGLEVWVSGGGVGVGEKQTRGWGMMTFSTTWTATTWGTLVLRTNFDINWNVLECSPCSWESTFDGPWTQGSWGMMFTVVNVADCSNTGLQIEAATGSLCCSESRPSQGPQVGLGPNYIQSKVGSGPLALGPFVNKSFTQVDPSRLLLALMWCIRVTTGEN